MKSLGRGLDILDSFAERPRQQFADLLAATPSTAILALVGALSLGGDFFAKYTIAKAGIYVPVMPAGRA